MQSYGSGCLTFDISLGCSGYVTGLSVLSATMQTHGMRCGLLVTAAAVVCGDLGVNSPARTPHMTARPTATTHSRRRSEGVTRPGGGGVARGGRAEVVGAVISCAMVVPASRPVPSLPGHGLVGVHDPGTFNAMAAAIRGRRMVRDPTGGDNA